MKNYQFPKSSDFEQKIGDETTRLIQLQNKNGMSVFLTNYGARIVSIFVKDQQGNLIDVNIGHASIGEYTREKANYYGAVIGRVCGRIRENKFSLSDTLYEMIPNNGNTFLHGGENAFHTKVYKVESQDEQSVCFSYFSKDGEEGFPGNLHFKTTYILTDDNALRIVFEAETDQKTPFNVTHHAYFNLNGEGNGDILNHDLQIFANEYLDIREDILPTGNLVPVSNSVFDFTHSKKIGKDIDADDEQIGYGSGYDHSFVLKHQFDSQLIPAAVSKGDLSGVVMKVYTNQPAVHLYTGNFMDGSFNLKHGTKDLRRTAFCLETQHFGDAMNHDHFPTVILEPNQTFTTETIFQFG